MGVDPHSSHHPVPDGTAQQQKGAPPNNRTRGGYLRTSKSHPRDAQVLPPAGQHQQKPPRIDPWKVLHGYALTFHPHSYSVVHPMLANTQRATLLQSVSPVY